MSQPLEPLTRRSFLGLVGASLVAAATPEVFAPTAATPQGPYTVTGLLARNPTDAPVAAWVYRPGGRAPLLHFTVGPGGMYSWHAMPGSEIVALQSTALLEVDAPGIEWSCAFHDANGRHYVYDTDGRHVPLEV